MAKNGDAKKDKWEFEDYAFLITGIIVVFLLVAPELLYEYLGISILGGSLGGREYEIGEIIEGGQGWTITALRALSPMLFLLTTAIVFWYEAIVARKTGGYKGSVFTHTFESLFEDAIYMTITAAMVYAAIFAGAMYISWLAAPITWILFIFIFPLFRKKADAESERMPLMLLAIFAIGVIVELVTFAWIAFPLAWLIICAIKLVRTIRAKINTIDDVFNLLYFAFSVVLMALGIAIDFWLASWIAFPFALLICWIMSKFGKFKKAKEIQKEDSNEQS